MIYELHQGEAPLLVSVPHSGTFIPLDLRENYTKRALRVEDTDWYLDELYAFVKDKGASLLTSQVSRYVIDNNRDPTNSPMYAGQNNTELCPTRHFSGVTLYKKGFALDEDEITRRKNTYWQAYHSALEEELTRLKTKHGYALLWDGHSIKSHLKWLFEGKLPDINLGTNNGLSCDVGLQTRLSAIAAHSGFSAVTNGRFKGGYITRHYGRPSENIHAVQLEMCFSTYMQEKQPFLRDEARISRLMPLLEAFIDEMLRFKC